MSVNLLLSPNSRSIYSKSLTVSKGFSYPNINVTTDGNVDNYLFKDAPENTIVTAVKNQSCVIGSMIYFNASLTYQKPNSSTNALKFSIKGAPLPAYRQVVELFVTLTNATEGTVAYIENINDETVVSVVKKSEVLDPVRYNQIVANGVIKISGCYFA